MTTNHPQLISRIERTNVVLGVAVTALCGLVWQLPGMLAAGLGATLGALNFWALHRLGAGVVARMISGEGAGKAGLLVMLLAAKMGLVFFFVWLATLKFGLLPVPFTIGISAFVASVLLVSISGSGLLSTTPSPTAGEAKIHG